MTRRRLTPDEIALWQKVTEKAERLHPESEAPVARTVPKPRPKKPALPRSNINSFEIGQKVPQKPAPHDLKPTLPQKLAAAPVAMDRKAFNKMKRGKLAPEARIDLHGMTVDRAHTALNRFILSSQASGRRLVLVITGKGKDRDEGGPIPQPRGTLKHQVPRWLALPPLAQAVLQVAEAHISHGGSGAYYVYLRRGR